MIVDLLKLPIFYKSKKSYLACQDGTFYFLAYQQLRYERKYKIEGLTINQIIQILNMNPIGLKPLYEPRQVNNVYFDTEAFSSYKNNVDGIAQRKKYRVRWYGDLQSIVQSPKLEIKIRNNELGDKITYDLTSFNLSDISDLIKEVNSNCPETGRNLQAKLFNSYYRCYFISPDGKFRITIDTNLEYSPVLNSNLKKNHFYKDHQSIILELKYDSIYDDQVDEILRFIPFRRSKNSKYVSGIEICYEK